jgi:hypothetical protein
MEEKSIEERIKELYVNESLSVGFISQTLKIDKSVICRIITRYHLKHAAIKKQVVPSNFLDFSEKQDRLKVFIEENDNISEIFWRYSSRGKGIHLKIILKRQVSVLENFMYRAQLEDDIYRIKADLVRYASGKEINRLWDAKIVKGEEFYAGEWRKFKN